MSWRSLSFQCPCDIIIIKSPMPATTPSLYGISNSNRDYSDPYYWGKNQFNSSFPIALANYMRDNKNNAIYLKLDDKCTAQQSEVSFDVVFGSSLPHDELFFAFETRYEPFGKFVHDELETIDCVVKKLTGDSLRPIEIKLTTLPDETTYKKSEDKYGSELVVRSPTMRYMALSIAESCEEDFERIQEIFEPHCYNIRDWESTEVMKNKRKVLFGALEQFFGEFQHKQNPLLMQPIWKTKGKSASLAENCLDIFVWSDFALSRLFMDSANASIDSEKISRHQRAGLRLARFLYEVSKGRKVYQEPIYDGMTFNTLNDKEFSISGAKTNALMYCERLTEPLIQKEEIKNIILGGGQKHLSPERRFDAIIYFSTDLFKEEE